MRLRWFYVCVFILFLAISCWAGPALHKTYCNILLEKPAELYCPPGWVGKTPEEYDDQMFYNVPLQGRLYKKSRHAQSKLFAGGIIKASSKQELTEDLNVYLEEFRGRYSEGVGAYGKQVHITFKRCRISRLNKGYYSGKECAISFRVYNDEGGPDWTKYVRMRFAIGSPTKWGSGRYKGMDVIPIYIILYESDAQNRKMLNESLESFKVP